MVGVTAQDPSAWGIVGGAPYPLGLVPTGARVSFGQLVAASAAHDDNHLEQLKRALDGRP